MLAFESEGYYNHLRIHFGGLSMKKILISLFSICVSAAVLTGCAAPVDAAGAAGTGSMLAAMMPMLIILLVMYVMMIVPERRRKKAAQQMRDSIEVGDKIVTIGGMIGKVVHVSADKVTFETGEDRVRIEINKWAVSTNEGKGANKETVSSDETISG